MNITPLDRWHAATAELKHLAAIQEACRIFWKVDPVFAEQEMERTRALIIIMEKYREHILQKLKHPDEDTGA